MIKYMINKLKRGYTSAIDNLNNIIKKSQILIKIIIQRISQNIFYLRYVIGFFFAMGFNNYVRTQSDPSLLFTAMEFSLISGSIILMFSDKSKFKIPNVDRKFILGGTFIFLPFAMMGLVGGETFLGHFSFPIDSVMGHLISFLSANMNLLGLIFIIDGIFDMIIYYKKNRILYSKKEGKMVLGIFSGIGDSFKINPHIMRLILVLLILFSSSQWLNRIITFFTFALFYVILYVVLPKKK